MTLSEEKPNHLTDMDETHQEKLGIRRTSHDLKYFNKRSEADKPFLQDAYESIFPSSFPQHQGVAISLCPISPRSVEVHDLNCTDFFDLEAFFEKWTPDRGFNMIMLLSGEGYTNGQDALTRILFHYQVMPDFVEFIPLPDGKWNNRVDHFRLLVNNRREPWFQCATERIDSFQLCYSLSFCLGEPSGLYPSIFLNPGQVGVNIQVKPLSGFVLPILAGPPRLLHNIRGWLLSEDQRMDLNEVLEQGEPKDFIIHLCLCTTASESWSAYIPELDSQVSRLYHEAKATSPNDDTEIDLMQVTPADTLNVLSDLDYSLQSCIIPSLKSNLKVIQSIASFQKVLFSASLNYYRSGPFPASFAMEKLERQTERQIEIAHSLIDRIKITRTLMTDTYKKKHEKAQNWVAVNSLKLRFVAGAFTRIVGIVIVLFVPAMCVSLFYLNFIYYTPGGSRIVDIEGLWTWFATVVPLTIFTFVILYFFNSRAQGKQVLTGIKERLGRRCRDGANLRTNGAAPGGESRGSV